MTQLSSILSYKERGKFGDNRYPGNYSGNILLALHQVFRFNEVSDYMRGGKTTDDVANYLKIKSNTYDLNMGFDLVTEDIKERNEFIMFHPPYWDIIKYSGNAYGDKPFKNDLSHIADYDEFLRMLNYCIEKQFASLKTGGRMAILVGDARKAGRSYTIAFDMAKPGTIQNILIKEQHNCSSDKKQYKGSFFKQLHEYIVILRKDNPYLYQLKITNNLDLDIRDNENITWKDLLASVHEKIGYAELDRVYEQLQGHKKTINNPHWKEKVRQTYQRYSNIFTSQRRGCWGLCKAA